MNTIYKAGLYALCLWGISACNESNRLMYDNGATIYFHLPQKDSVLIIKGDTATYSFAFEEPSVEEQTIYIPVEIGGFRSDDDRSYRIEIIADGSTAIPDEDYKPLGQEQIFHAGAGQDSLPIVIYRSPELRRETRNIQIRLLPSDNFELGPVDQLFVNIRFSDILEEPGWWENWRYYFGPYHRIKYQEWIRIWGGTGDLSGKTPTPYYSPNEIMAIMELKEYFEKNPRYTLEEDNDPAHPGERIFVPCPLK